MCIIKIGSSDFERLIPLRFIINGDDPSTDIRIFTVNDEMTLEYDDRVLLRFTPTNVDLILVLASHFEYIRDTAVVNIVDNDRKCLYPLIHVHHPPYVSHLSSADQFWRVRLFHSGGFR